MRNFIQYSITEVVLYYNHITTEVKERSHFFPPESDTCYQFELYLIEIFVQEGQGINYS